MSFAEIEAELERLSPEELRKLAIKSWNAYMKNQDPAGAVNECSEDDPALLAALDEAIAAADATPGRGCSAGEVRSRLRRWRNDPVL